MGTPNTRTAKMNNKRNEPAVCMRAPPKYRGRGVHPPHHLEHRSEVSRSIPLNNGLRDADERNQTDDHQYLYQHGIPQPHNLLLRGILAHNPIAIDVF
jgi:hypothetical protein